MLRSSTLIAFLGFSLLYLTSYSTGPTGRAGDVTGSPISTQQCAGCHNGGNFEADTEIAILDNGATVTSYEPGKTYTLRVSVDAQNSPAGYGFQAVVMDAANNNAGTFGAPSGDFRVSTAGSRDYLEHSRRQTSPVVEIEWTAPAAGTGEVLVYAAGNAINGNGSTAGDNANTEVLSIAEGSPSSTADLNASEAFTVIQTSGNSLQFELGEQLALPVHYTLHDMSGKVLQASTLNATENTVAFQAVTPQVVVVVLHDANGQRGAQRVALR